jgi:DNA-binding SARP family transcriptional activator
VGDASGIDSVLEHLARLTAARGDPRRAIRLAAAAARVRGVSESAIVEVAYGAMGSGLEGVRLRPDEIAAARREGEGMSTAEAVAYALAGGGDGSGGLRVKALGSMHVERGGVPMRRWGGEKAGSRQAQAIFAFLFDRGEAGVLKDEVTELLWPDLEIRRGDLAFHRTLGGLRSVLDKGEDGDSIRYDGGRYRLAPHIVAWSDVAAFEELLDGASARGAGASVAALEEARILYRGDYLDDCPFFGDSSFVEERRAYLRGRFEDLLVKLGDRYRETGDADSAAARYRQALGVNPTSTAARAGLERLGAVVGAEPVQEPVKTAT